MIEIEDDEQEQSVVDELKVKLKESLSGYFKDYDGILYLYALYELAADLSVERGHDECFDTVWGEVYNFHFKGEKLPLMVEGE